MNVRVVIQTNPDTKEKNVSFLTDPLSTIEDVLVRAWPDSEIVVKDVVLVADAQTLAEIGQHTFRSLSNNDTGEEPSGQMTIDDALAALDGRKAA